MTETLQEHLLTPEQAVEQAAGVRAANGIRYAVLGSMEGSGTPASDMARLAGTVPAAIAEGVARHVYLFAPLVLSGARMEGEDSGPSSATDRTLISPLYSHALSEQAICHRNAGVGGLEYVFLSSRLHSDRFALAFEFFINVAHNFVDAVGAPASFGELVWKQATAGVRGETSIDAWEDRAQALGQPLPDGKAEAKPRPLRNGGIDEQARSSFYSVAFADALAIYLLSMFLDFDYADLREREYPLLAAPALAERLRAVHRLFPPNEGYTFQILYRRRG